MINWKWQKQNIFKKNLNYILLAIIIIIAAIYSSIHPSMSLSFSVKDTHSIFIAKKSDDRKILFSLKKWKIRNMIMNSNIVSMHIITIILKEWVKKNREYSFHFIHYRETWFLLQQKKKKERWWWLVHSECVGWWGKQYSFSLNEIKLTK